MLKFLFVFIFLMAMPLAAHAHGGVEKSDGNTTVFLSQTPLSPFVGEKVTMSFVFAESDTGKRLQSVPVTLSLIDTYSDDESKDVVMLTTQRNTDANGSLVFEYTYDKENYFDVEIAFKDPRSGEDREIGYLVQPRSVPTAVASPAPVKSTSTSNTARLFSVGAAGVVIGFGAALFRKR